jgi:hypothetical protein
MFGEQVLLEYFTVLTDFWELSPNNAIYVFGDVAFVDITSAEWGSKRKRERKEENKEEKRIKTLFQTWNINC